MDFLEMILPKVLKLEQKKRPQPLAIRLKSLTTYLEVVAKPVFNFSYKNITCLLGSPHPQQALQI